MHYPVVSHVMTINATPKGANYSLILRYYNINLQGKCQEKVFDFNWQAIRRGMHNSRRRLR